MSFDPTACSDNALDCSTNIYTIEQLLRLIFTTDASGCLRIRTATDISLDVDTLNVNMVDVENLLDAINAKIPSLGVVETPTASTVSSSGTVSAGKKSVTFTTDSSFVGTILGEVRAASTTYSFSVANPNATLSAIAYTRSAGSMVIDVTT